MQADQCQLLRRGERREGGGVFECLIFLSSFERRCSRNRMNRKCYASKINTAYMHMFLTVNRPIKTSIKELGEERNTIKHVYTVSE